MKIDFENIKRMNDALHQAFLEDGGDEAWLKGTHVYSLHFEPDKHSASMHLQWPLFVQTVANMADKPATYVIHSAEPAGATWMHWNCSVLGIDITACIDRADMVAFMKQLDSVDFHYEPEDNVEDLFALWQHFTGWNLNWPKEVETRE